MPDPNSTQTTTIIAALSTLPPSHLSDLTYSILFDIHHHHRRLSAVLSSPILFSLTLHRLSLPHKTLLIARHLLASLHHLTRHLHPTITSPPHPSNTINHRDLDAVLLLLLLCELRHHNPEALETSPSTWRQPLHKYWFDTLLTLSGVGVYNGVSLIPYIEMLIRCLRFVGARGDRKARTEVAASPVAVVALPSVEASGGGVECVICKEEVEEGREVCELPCEHLFHWICILPWLRRRSTCPCCRFRLPSDDVFWEIERLWEVLVKVAGGVLNIQ